MLKPYKINKTSFDSKVSIELFWAVNDKKLFENVKKILEAFDISMPFVCKCIYDKERIVVEDIDNGIKIGVFEVKRKIRCIKLQEINIIVRSHAMLKELLNTVDIYDTMLVFSPQIEGSKTQFVINDNGDNYINFDKNQHNLDETIKKMNETLKQN